MCQLLCEEMSVFKNGFLLRKAQNYHNEQQIYSVLRFLKKHEAPLYVISILVVSHPLQTVTSSVTSNDIKNIIWHDTEKEENLPTTFHFLH